MTSAISGRIIYKQSDRAYLDANIRTNSLVFDLTNNRLLYSPSGTSYYEFYPGPHSSGTAPVSGSVDWLNILNKPIASNSTSGVLTVSDWLTFYGKADTSALNSLSATVDQLVLTSGFGGVSAVTWNIIQNVPVASVSTSGVLSTTDYTKFNSKADVSAIPSVSAYALNSSLSNYYPVSSTGNISGLTSPAQTQINTLSATVNQLVLTSGSGGVSAVTWNIIQNVPVASISTSGVLTSSDYNKFNSKAEVSAIPSTSAYVTSAYMVSYVQSHSISSVDWSIISNKPIASNSTSGVLTSSDYIKFNSKADVSAIPSTSGFISLSGGFISGNISASDISANKFYGDVSLTNIMNIMNQTLMLVSTTSSVPSATISNIKQFSFNVTPSILSFVVSGGISGNYTATYNIYTTLDDVSLYKIAYGVLTSANNVDSNSMINLYNYNKFAADVSLSGSSNSNITVYTKS